MSIKEQQDEALAQLRAVYEDGEAEINGRIYKFHKMTHIERRKAFAYQTSVQPEMAVGDFSFLDTLGYAQVEEMMWKNISYEGSLIAKSPGHWEDYPEDYMMLVSTAMGVMSYPFMRGVGIVSASKGAPQKKTTSSKPM